MMHEQGYYDMQDYPEMPVSTAFLIQMDKAMEQRMRGTMTTAEVAGRIIDYVLALDPSIRTKLQREHEAIVAHHNRRGATADEWARLKAELERSSAETRQILADMRPLVPERPRARWWWRRD
jgi:hypothetical protein